MLPEYHAQYTQYRSSKKMRKQNFVTEVDKWSVNLVLCPPWSTCSSIDNLSADKYINVIITTKLDHYCSYDIIIINTGQNHQDIIICLLLWIGESRSKERFYDGIVIVGSEWLHLTSAMRSWIACLPLDTLIELN